MGFSPQNSSLSSASDVALNSPASNNVLTYDTGTSKWKNASVDPATIGAATKNVAWFHLKDYGQVGDVRGVGDASIGSTGANAQVTSLQAAFSSADIGKKIQVPGAISSAGISRPLVATITAVNGNIATTDGTATLTVTNSKATIGTDDTTALVAAVNAACTYIQTTGQPATVWFSGRLFIATASAITPVAGGVTYAGALLGPTLPVNLPNNLTIKGSGRENAVFTLTDNARCLFWPFQQADYDVFQNVTFEDFDVDNNWATGKNHVVIGNVAAGTAPMNRLNIANIRVSRVNVYNTPTDLSQNLTYKSMVHFQGATVQDFETTQLTIRNIVVEDWTADTQQGVKINSNVGHNPNCYYDNIYIRRWVHTPQTTPLSATLQQTSAYICGSGMGGYGEITDGYSYNIGDDCIEVGGMQTVLIARIRGVNPFLNFITLRNSQAPRDPLSQTITIEDCVMTVNGSQDAVNPTGFSGGWLSTAVDDNTATGTINIASGSNTVTLASNPSSGVFIPGQVLVATGIPYGTRITAVSGVISGATLTIDMPATATASGTSATGVLDFGTIKIVRPKFKIIDCKASTFSNAASRNTIGYYFAGRVRNLEVTEPSFILENFTNNYSSGNLSVSPMVVALNPANIGATAGIQNPAVAVVRDFNVQFRNIDQASTTLFSLSGFWPAGNGVVDLDGMEVSAINLTRSGTGGFNSHLVQPGIAGTLARLRLSRISGHAYNSSVTARTGLNLASSGSFARLLVDECDFTRWTSSAGSDISYTNAPSGVGSLILFGRQNIFSNLSDASLGGFITTSVSKTLTPVVNSVGITSATAAPLTVTLVSPDLVPRGPQNAITIRDQGGVGATFDITILGTFANGLTSTVINVNYGYRTFYSDGSRYHIIATG